MDEKEFNKALSGLKDFLKRLIKLILKKRSLKDNLKNIRGFIGTPIWIVMAVMLLVIGIFIAFFWMIVLLPVQFIVYLFNKKKFEETFPQEFVSKSGEIFGNVYKNTEKLCDKIAGFKYSQKNKKTGGKKHGSKRNRNKQNQAKSVSG